MANQQFLQACPVFMSRDRYAELHKLLVPRQLWYGPTLMDNFAMLNEEFHLCGGDRASCSGVLIVVNVLLHEEFHYMKSFTPVEVTGRAAVGF